MLTNNVRRKALGHITFSLLTTLGANSAFASDSEYEYGHELEQVYDSRESTRLISNCPGCDEYPGPRPRYPDPRGPTGPLEPNYPIPDWLYDNQSGY